MSRDRAMQDFAFSTCWVAGIEDRSPKEIHPSMEFGSFQLYDLLWLEEEHFDFLIFFFAKGSLFLSVRE